MPSLSIVDDPSAVTYLKTTTRATFVTSAMLDKPCRVFSTAVAGFDELDHVQASLASLGLGDVAVGTPGLLAELTLGKASVDAHPSQQIKEAIVGGRVERLLFPPRRHAAAENRSPQELSPNATLLHNVGWLRSCRLIYWGDMDDTGFNILSRIREEYPQTESLLMDAATWQAHRPLAHSGNLDFHPPERLFLTSDEEAAWQAVREGRYLVEQEQIPLEVVNANCANGADS